MANPYDESSRLRDTYPGLLLCAFLALVVMAGVVWAAIVGCM